MVRKPVSLIVIFIGFLFISCDFFYATQFSSDLVYYDKSLDLKSTMPVIPEDYEISTVGELGILQGIYSTESSTLRRLILFDKNLNVLYNKDHASAGTFSLIDSNGNYVVGDQVFGPDGKSGPTDLTFDVPPSNPIDLCFGFSYSSVNYVLSFQDPKNLIINKYSNDVTGWKQITPNGTITITIATGSDLEYKSIQYSQAAGGTVIIFLSNSLTHTLYEMRISAASLPSSITDTMVTPLSTQDNLRYFLYTEKGFITKYWNNTYSLYSKSDCSLIDQREMRVLNNDSFYDTIDVNCTNRYVFISSIGYLYHSKMWW